MTTYVNPNAIKEHSVTSAHLADGVIPTDASIAGMGYTKNQGTITGITMNGNSMGTSGVVDLGTVLTTAPDISGKADSSAAIGSLSLSINSTNYQITLSGTKVNGTPFTVSNVIDLPLESVVVDGSYNNSTKKVVLTLQNGSSIDFSVADLVSGLQSEITTSNKLSADLISDGNTNKTVTATEKSTWNGKQDAISDLATIRANASEGAAKVSNVQANWNATTGLAVILNKPTLATVATSGSYSDLSNTPAPTTDASVSGWGYTKNTGTITGINMNGASKGTSGVVDLGTVITSETQLSKGTTTGNGNAVTDIAVSGHQITLTKGTTFLTSHQSIKTLNSESLTGTGNITINGLPSVTSADNGKIIMVVNGQWSMVEPVAIYSGDEDPSNNLGKNGDLYLQTE